MSTESIANVLYGARDLKLETFPVPEIGADDGLLRVEVTGVCGSDWTTYEKGGMQIYELPCVLGHEVVGRIERIGPEASRRWGVREGDRVAVEEFLPCGTCRACLDGYSQMCTRTRYGGKSIHDAPSLWGGYSDYMYLHPQALVSKIDPDVPVELTQLFVPISNGLYWTQEVGRVRVGSTVVVLGAGPHGLSCVVGAKVAGASCIVLVGLASDAYRLQVGRELGADHTFAADADDVPGAVRDLTGGRLADTVVNVAPSASAFELALELVGERGSIVQAGLSGQLSTALPADDIVWKAVTITGVRGRPSRMVPPAIKLIESGAFPLEKMCTHRFPIVETEDAIRTAGGELGNDVVRVSVMSPELIEEA
jgi:threonine dehydrogenase-like Zn-dependent dehydrogenase